MVSDRSSAHKFQVCLTQIPQQRVRPQSLTYDTKFIPNKGGVVSVVRPSEAWWLMQHGSGINHNLICPGG